MTPGVTPPAGAMQGGSGWQGPAAPGGSPLPATPAPAALPGDRQPSSDSPDPGAAAAAAQQRLQAHFDAFLAAHDQESRFIVDKSTGMTIVRIVKRANGELVRQIPTEEVVRIAQYLDAQNVLLDVKA